MWLALFNGLYILSSGAQDKNKEMDSSTLWETKELTDVNTFLVDFGNPFKKKEVKFLGLSKNIDSTYMFSMRYEGDTMQEILYYEISEEATYIDSISLIDGIYFYPGERFIQVKVGDSVFNMFNTVTDRQEKVLNDRTYFAVTHLSKWRKDVTCRVPLDDIFISFDSVDSDTVNGFVLNKGEALKVVFKVVKGVFSLHDEICYFDSDSKLLKTTNSFLKLLEKR